MEQGWDPEVKALFRKILNSLAWFLIWLIAAISAGIYYGLAFTGSVPVWATALYYVLLVLSFGLLLRYFFRTWKK